jgi:hypothetical protein
MATRSDISFYRRRFVPCLLPFRPGSWILRGCSVFSTKSSRFLEGQACCRIADSSFSVTVKKFSVESGAILQ